jgi:preprotein translocase subunit YajC
METLLLPLLLFAVFYFVLIRPQQKQRKEIAQFQSTIAPGARVLTGSGLVATVVSVEGDEVLLEVAPGVTNRYVRRAIMRALPDETSAVGESVTDESDAEPITESVPDEAVSRPVSDRTNRDDVSGTSP